MTPQPPRLSDSIERLLEHISTRTTDKFQRAEIVADIQALRLAVAGEIEKQSFVVEPLLARLAGYADEILRDWRIEAGDSRTCAEHIRDEARTYLGAEAHAGTAGTKQAGEQSALAETRQAKASAQHIESGENPDSATSPAPVGREARPFKTCPKCGGDGRTNSTKGTCPRCNGSGKELCNHVRGFNAAGLCFDCGWKIGPSVGAPSREAVPSEEAVMAAYYCGMTPEQYAKGGPVLPSIVADVRKMLGYAYAVDFPSGPDPVRAADIGPSVLERDNFLLREKLDEVLARYDDFRSRNVERAAQVADAEAERCVPGDDDTGVMRNLLSNCKRTAEHIAANIRRLAAQTNGTP